MVVGTCDRLMEAAAGESPCSRNIVSLMIRNPAVRPGNGSTIGSPKLQAMSVENCRVQRLSTWTGGSMKPATTTEPSLNWAACGLPAISSFTRTAGCCCVTITVSMSMLSNPALCPPGLSYGAARSLSAATGFSGRPDAAGAVSCRAMAASRALGAAIVRGAGTRGSGDTPRARLVAIGAGPRIALLLVDELVESPRNLESCSRKLWVGRFRNPRGRTESGRQETRRAPITRPRARPVAPA